MNIQSVDFPFRYHYFPTVWPCGTEYRYCYSMQPIWNFGFAVWHERTNGRTLVTDEPQFVKSRKSAKNLAQEQRRISQVLPALHLPSGNCRAG
jgi:hypothetical protein